MNFRLFGHHKLSSHIFSSPTSRKASKTLKFFIIFRMPPPQPEQREKVLSCESHNHQQPIQLKCFVTEIDFFSSINLFSSFFCRLRIKSVHIREELFMGNRELQIQATYQGLWIFALWAVFILITEKKSLRKWMSFYHHRKLKSSLNHKSIYTVTP
jgi:hypothetical protein